MSKFLPPSTPELNRLRAAATLITIIESGLADSELSADKAALMASFCEWVGKTAYSNPEEMKLSERISQGLGRVKFGIAISG